MTYSDDFIKLTGHQFMQFVNALLDAFPSHFQLASMLKYRLNKNLNAIALGDNLHEIIFKLIVQAQAEGWLINLLIAARESNPGNNLLIEFAQQYGLTSLDLKSNELEKIIKKSKGFLDINVWRSRLGEIEAQVCRIEIPTKKGTIYGTGFLIGHNIVITNYHVIEDVLNGSADHKDIICRFDYKKLYATNAITLGKECKLHKIEWLIDKSPYTTKTTEYQDDKLDYALLRLNDSIGNDYIGISSEPGANKRGWIKVPDKSCKIEVGMTLLIIQHPKGDSLKLALDTDAVININSNNTIVKYKTNTLSGSSGSPCFNINLDLIAIHHSGDPDAINPSFNAGTPIHAIIKLLKKKGLGNLIVY